MIRSVFFKYPTISFAALIVVIGGCSLFVLFLINSSGKVSISATTPAPTARETHDIELRDDGFYPEKLTIHKGDTVTFTTMQNKPFWPASNLHPSHTVYPELDPKEPVTPAEGWSFRFDRVGEWRYHDHLAPLHRGTITVLAEEHIERGFNLTENTCDDLDQWQQDQCWENVVGDALTEGGIEAAFDVVASIYDIHPDCHGYGHLIGEEAYRLFAAGKEMTLTPKTYYCGYGFYHGFMETLLHTTGDIQEAREFCMYTDKQLLDRVVGGLNACFHGIGHGVVDGYDQGAWGDAEAMIAPGIEMCELVAGTDFELYLCASGVFNAIEILSAYPKYKLSKIREDPFGLCHKQPYHYREACYTNMLPVYLGKTKSDFLKIARVIEDTITQDDDYKIRSKVISSLFHEIARVNLKTGDNSDSINLCRSLNESSRLPCIDGLSGGHIKYGEPEKEYIEGLRFCKSELLFEDEKEVCFKRILPRLRLWYSAAKTLEICETVEEKYRNFCVY